MQLVISAGYYLRKTVTLSDNPDYMSLKRYPLVSLVYRKMKSCHYSSHLWTWSIIITCRWCWSFLSIKREREHERRGEKVKDKTHKSSTRRLSTLLSRSVNVVYRCLALTARCTCTCTRTCTTIAKSVFHIKDSNELQPRKFYSSSINTNP